MATRVTRRSSRTSCWSRKSRSTGCAVSTDARGSGPAPRFDLDRAWCVDDRVAVRPEPFGALLYHFGTRRLSFLKNTTVLAAVLSLADPPTARSACAAAGVRAAPLPAYERALATLAAS